VDGLLTRWFLGEHDLENTNAIRTRVEPGSRRIRGKAQGRLFWLAPGGSRPSEVARIEGLKGPDLAPHVYDELRRLAAAHMREQAAGHTLQPTALVSEAWLKLASHSDSRFEDRRSYLVLASRAMRQVLIDHARRKRSEKRGGQWKRLTLAGLEASGGDLDVDLLTLEDALSELERFNPDRVRLVELRFFGGLTETEASEVLGVSRREASRQWRAARAFLLTRLQAGDDDPGQTG